MLLICCPRLRWPWACKFVSLAVPARQTCLLFRPGVKHGCLGHRSVPSWWLLRPEAEIMTEGAEETKKKWLRLGEAWRQKLLLDPTRPELGSWLQCQDSPWGVGCTVCQKAGLPGRLANFEVVAAGALQFSNLQKHASSPSHQKALRKHLAGLSKETRALASQGGFSVLDGRYRKGHCSKLQKGKENAMVRG